MKTISLKKVLLMFYRMSFKLKKPPDNKHGPEKGVKN